ncbi:MAG: MFS transporter [Verrucomicrobiales bacterium]|nr:MFS transporter [Verrucomicrobiales bacterium]
MSDPNHFPVKNPWRSLAGVLFVQAQNAFNDNFLKIILISLAGAVASGQFIGDNAQRVFSAFIPLAFIIFSPLAGYFADKFSKRNVIFWCVIGQLVILVLTLIGIKMENLWVAVFGLFFLSLQSTFFSPAKQGILKELVGSRKLTFANGFAQMLTMLAILGGITLGGEWFGKLSNAGQDNWSAAYLPIFAVSLFSFIPLLLHFSINKTPVQTAKKFEIPILWRHFGYLKELFHGDAMRRTALGISYYWLVATFFGVILFDFGKMLHPEAPGDASIESSRLFRYIGIGLMVGSVLVSNISRNGVKLGLIPIGGIGLTLGMILTGFLPGGSFGFYAGFITVGFFGGFFLVPLSSNLQDIAPNETRGRIIGASAVFTSITSLLAIVISLIFTKFGLALGYQMLFFVIPTLLFTWYVSGLMKIQDGKSVPEN